MSDYFIIAASLMRRHRSRGGGLSPRAALIMFVFLAVCGVIAYFCYRSKKNGIMKGLGFDDETDYRIFKESCPFKYGSYYMSEEWTVNESSLKYYRTSEIFDVSPMLPGNSGDNSLTKRGILIRYSGGSDKLFVNSSFERDKTAAEINEFLKNNVKRDPFNRIY